MIRVWGLASLICSAMGAVDAYCSTSRGVTDERWTWIFVEVSYIFDKLM